MAVLSFVLPGLGQLLCGQKNKGITFLISSILGHVLSGGLTSLFICPFMALDAYSVAKKINESGFVAEWEFCPTIPEINRIEPRVSSGVLIGSIALVTIGTLLYVKHQKGAASTAYGEKVAEDMLRLIQQEQQRRYRDPTHIRPGE